VPEVRPHAVHLLTPRDDRPGFTSSDPRCAGRARTRLDPNLFNVMVTLAREEVVVVTWLPPGTRRLVGDCLRYGLQCAACAAWDITEAFDTRWRERRTELTVELVPEAQRRMPS
jgi:hypothetical protein